MLSLSAAACAYSLNAPVVVPHHVAPRSGRPVLAMSRREMGQSAALAAALAATLQQNRPVAARVRRSAAALRGNHGEVSQILETTRSRSASAGT